MYKTFLWKYKINSPSLRPKLGLKVPGLFHLPEKQNSALKGRNSLGKCARKFLGTMGTTKAKIGSVIDNPGPGGINCARYNLF